MEQDIDMIHMKLYNSRNSVHHSDNWTTRKNYSMGELNSPNSIRSLTHVQAILGHLVNSTKSATNFEGGF